MRSLVSVMCGTNKVPYTPTGEKYRAAARFVMDPLSASTPLDRNQRAKIIAVAEGIERRTKAPGKRCGILGLTGLQVLRVLLMQFHNRAHGLCCPSIEKLREVTGFCKQTVVKAIRALEAVGLMRVTRRLVRKMVDRGGYMVRAAVQGSNLYAFNVGGQIAIKPLPAGRAKSFPKPNALISLMFRPSLLGREKPQSPGIPSYVGASRA
jgi:helix-turn-helix protein